MGIFGRKKSDEIGLGQDMSESHGDATVLTEAEHGPVQPSETSADSQTAVSDDLDMLIRDTAGTKPGKVRLSKEEKAEKARLAREEKAARRADRLASRRSAKDGVEGTEEGDGMTAKPARRSFSLRRRKPEAATAGAPDEVELITGEPDTRLSVSVVIEFLQGYAKDDAIVWAKRWAMDKMSVPSDCYYFVMKYPGGYAVEIQEGVGQAYLPSVMNLATRNPGRMVIVPMSRRKMTVRYTERTDDFEAYVLPENQEPPITGTEPLFAKRSGKMKPIMHQHIQWLYAGVATSVIGGLFLLSSLMVYAFDPGAKVPPEWRTTAIPRLPVMQWNRLQPDATDSYVVRMEFADGQWRIIRQASGATAEVATPEAGPDSSIVGGAVAAPTAPDAVGTIPPPPPAGVVVTPLPGGVAQIPPPNAAPVR